MTSASQVDNAGSDTRAQKHITTHPTTSTERKAEREKLSKSRQKTFLSDPSSSSNRTVMLPDQTSHKSDPIKKAQKKMQKKMDRILGPLSQG